LIHGSPGFEGYKSNAVRLCLKHSPTLRLEQLEWFTFMPTLDAYFASFCLDDGRQTSRWHGVPKSLDVHLNAVASKGISSLSVGKHGCWVTILNDGTIHGFGIASGLQGILQTSQGLIEVRTHLTF
jgi:hypothetical protein